MDDIPNQSIHVSGRISADFTEFITNNFYRDLLIVKGIQYVLPVYRIAGSKRRGGGGGGDDDEEEEEKKWLPQTKPPVVGVSSLVCPDLERLNRSNLEGAYSNWQSHVATWALGSIKFLSRTG